MAGQRIVPREMRSSPEMRGADRAHDIARAMPWASAFAPLPVQSRGIEQLHDLIV